MNYLSSDVYPTTEAASSTFLASLLELHTATRRREANDCAVTRAAWNTAMDAALEVAGAMLDEVGADADDEVAVDRWLESLCGKRRVDPLE